MGRMAALLAIVAVGLMLGGVLLAMAGEIVPGGVSFLAASLVIYLRETKL